MATGQRAIGSNREPEEWIRATAKAREVRVVVAGQAADLLVASDISGGDQLVAQRIREYSEARRERDVMVMRAAAMNAAVAWLALAVRFDLRQDFPSR